VSLPVQVSHQAGEDVSEHDDSRYTSLVYNWKVRFDFEISDKGYLMINRLNVLVLTLLISVPVFGADPDKLPMLDKILSWIPSDLQTVGIVAAVMEFLMRMIPSQKPLSIMHVVAAVVKQLGAILNGVGALLDKVLPQKIKPPE